MNIKAWIGKNKKEFLILLLILLVGAFLRLYRIDEYMIFLGDEGRDVIAVRRLLVYGDLIFVGPGTSLGNMYLGPLYYYMMAPSLLLANFSPVGPAVMVALLGVATILLVWYVSKEWFGNIPALLTSFLYAISPTVIIFSKSSWNPNIIPFFSLVAIYAIWKVWSVRQAKWLIVLGISYAFVLQSHYFGILLTPVLFIFWILGLKRAKESQSVGNFIRYTIYGALLFTVLMFPLVLFDFKHNWRNFIAMKDFIFENQGSFSGGVQDIFKRLLPVFRQLITRLIAGRNEFIGLWTAFILGLSTVVLFVKRRKRGLILILVWLMVGIFGLASFNQQIFDHYFGFLFPAPFLLLGAISQHIVTYGNKWVKILFLSIYLLLVGVNLMDTPIRYPPN